EVDGVLALVVGRAPAVDALAVARELPRLEPGAPLALLAADDVAMSVAQHRRERRALDALGDEEWAVVARRIGHHAAGEAHALEAFRDLGLEVAHELCAPRRVLALGGYRHAAREVLEEPSLVEVALGGEDGLRAAHLGSIARGHGGDARGPGLARAARSAARGVGRVRQAPHALPALDARAPRGPGGRRALDAASHRHPPLPAHPARSTPAAGRR